MELTSHPNDQPNYLPLDTSLSSNDQPFVQSSLQHLLTSRFLKATVPPLSNSSIPPPLPVPSITPSEEDKEALSDEVMVPLQDHPEYSKFLKMMKVGLPLPAIREKIRREGYDPKYLDCSPETLIPLKKPSVVLNHPLGSNELKKVPTKQQPKRRKIHWQAIKEEDVDPEMNIWITSPQALNQDSITSQRVTLCKEDGIEIDELRKLFVLKLSLPFFKLLFSTDLSSLSLL